MWLYVYVMQRVTTNVIWRLFCHMFKLCIIIGIWWPSNSKSSLMIKACEKLDLDQFIELTFAEFIQVMRWSVYLFASSVCFSVLSDKMFPGSENMTFTFLCNLRSQVHVVIIVSVSLLRRVEAALNVCNDSIWNTPESKAAAPHSEDWKRGYGCYADGALGLSFLFSTFLSLRSEFKHQATLKTTSKLPFRAWADAQ